MKPAILEKENFIYVFISIIGLSRTRYSSS